MKRLFLLLIFLFTALPFASYGEEAGDASAQESQLSEDTLNKSWQEGLDALAEKDYSTAIDRFEKIARQYESAAVYHNLSLAYAGGGRMGFSVLAKERALILKPNLYSGNFWSKFMLPPNYILFLGVVAFWHLLFFLTARIFSYDRKTIRNIFLSFAFLWLFACCYGVWRERNSFSKAIVVSEGKQLKVSPTDHSPDVASLKEGESVKVLKMQGDWYEVRTSGNQTGWVSEKDCITVWK